MKAFKRRRLVFWVVLGSWLWRPRTRTLELTTGMRTVRRVARQHSHRHLGRSTFWNSNSTGGSGTFITTSGSADNLNFIAAPAANSGENPYTVTVSGSQNANSLVFQSAGRATLWERARSAFGAEGSLSRNTLMARLPKGP